MTKIILKFILLISVSIFAFKTITFIDIDGVEVSLDGLPHIGKMENCVIKIINQDLYWYKYENYTF